MGHPSSGGLLCVCAGGISPSRAWRSSRAARPSGNDVAGGGGGVLAL